MTTDNRRVQNVCSIRPPDQGKRGTWVQKSTSPTLSPVRMIQQCFKVLFCTWPS